MQRLQFSMQRFQLSMSHVRRVPVIIGLFFVCMFVALFTVYMTVFNHGPPAEIIEANRRAIQMARKKDAGSETGELSDIVDKGAKVWQDFVERNEFVSVGDVYNSCGELFISFVKRLKFYSTKIYIMHLR